MIIKFETWNQITNYLKFSWKPINREHEFFTANYVLRPLRQFNTLFKPDLTRIIWGKITALFFMRKYYHFLVAAITFKMLSKSQLFWISFPQCEYWQSIKKAWLWIHYRSNIFKQIFLGSLLCCSIVWYLKWSRVKGI